MVLIARVAHDPGALDGAAAVSGVKSIVSSSSRHDRSARNVMGAVPQLEHDGLS